MCGTASGGMWCVLLLRVKEKEKGKVKVIAFVALCGVPSRALAAQLASHKRRASRKSNLCSRKCTNAGQNWPNTQRKLPLLRNSFHFHDLRLTSSWQEWR